MTTSKVVSGVGAAGIVIPIVLVGQAS